MDLEDKGTICSDFNISVINILHILCILCFNRFNITYNLCFCKIISMTISYPQYKHYFNE